jgi:AraC-like DNA-binding protein
VARDVLKTHPQPLAAVARGVGYESETAFSQAFKKAFGVSPGRYRAQAAAEALDIRPPELSAP